MYWPACWRKKACAASRCMMFRDRCIRAGRGKFPLQPSGAGGADLQRRTVSPYGGLSGGSEGAEPAEPHGGAAGKMAHGRRFPRSYMRTVLESMKNMTVLEGAVALKVRFGGGSARRTGGAGGGDCGADTINHSTGCRRYAAACFFVRDGEKPVLLCARGCIG